MSRLNLPPTPVCTLCSCSCQTSCWPPLSGSWRIGSFLFGRWKHGLTDFDFTAASRSYLDMIGFEKGIKAMRSHICLPSSCGSLPNDSASIFSSVVKETVVDSASSPDPGCTWPPVEQLGEPPLPWLRLTRGLVDFGKASPENGMFLPHSSLQEPFASIPLSRSPPFLLVRFELVLRIWFAPALGIPGPAWEPPGCTERSEGRPCSCPPRSASPCRGTWPSRPYASRSRWCYQVLLHFTV